MNEFLFFQRQNIQQLWHFHTHSPKPKKKKSFDSVSLYLASSKSSPFCIAFKDNDCNQTISVTLNRYYRYRYFGSLLISKLLFWPVIRIHKRGLYFIQPFIYLQNLVHVLTDTQLVNFILFKIAPLQSFKWFKRKWWFIFLINWECEWNNFSIHFNDSFQGNQDNRILFIYFYILIIFWFFC